MSEQKIASEIAETTALLRAVACFDGFYVFSFCVQHHNF